MLNFFDLRSIFLAKHAQHIVLIHFPIALFMSGVLLDLLSRFKRFSQFANAAYLNLSLAAAFVPPTILTGLLAWHFALAGQRLKGLLLWHMVAAITAALLVLTSWWLHWRGRKHDSQALPRSRIVIEIIGVALVALTAHLGGFLSGVNL